MAISVRLSKDEAQLIKMYAQLNGISVSELVRQSVLERIEDEYDLMVYNTAIAEFRAKAEIYSLDEVESELGLK